MTSSMQPEIAKLIEELATASMLSEWTDNNFYKDLLSNLPSLEALATSYPGAEKICKEIEQIAKIGLSEPDETFPGKLSDLFSQFLELENSVQKTRNNEFQLPPWVDEPTFKDFLSNQRTVLDDIESLLLQLEKGDLSILQILKGLFHTMKGESGVLNLLDIQELCHKCEDIMIEWKQGDSGIEILFQACDWFREANSSYENFKIPGVSHRSILEQIENFSQNSQAEKVADEPQNNTDLENTSQTPSDAVDSEFTNTTPVKPDESAEASTESNQGKVVLIPGFIDFTELSREYEIPDFASLEPDWDAETTEMLGEFINEGEEGLTRVDEILMNSESDGLGETLINDLFRVFHTIKGVAGFLELKEIEKLAHTTETLLNMGRKGEIEIIGCRLDLIFDSTELMRKMITSIRIGIETGKTISPQKPLKEHLVKLNLAIDGRITDCHEMTAKEGDRIGEILVNNKVVSESVVNGTLTDLKSGQKLGAALVEKGHVKPKEVAKALKIQRKVTGELKTVKDIKATVPEVTSVEKHSSEDTHDKSPVEQNQVDSSKTEEAKATTDKKATKLKETVKIDLEKVDNLVEMIGELVIVESMVTNAPEIIGISSLKVRNYINQLNKITRDLQSVSMMMRMVPVKGVFQKMARMVRDLSRKSGKSIAFEQKGETTEIDRNIVEYLGDPLVHMIRNSVDHGIESKEDRIASGKNPTGKITLSAYHEGGKIIIEIGDDGKGLNKEAILSKAMRQGLINSEDRLNESDIYNLIFAPGFSTAKQVTEISGRGVGMDVVKRNIESLRGKVLISTSPGEGTVFKIVLPMTTAIIDGMLVECGNEQYIIPTLSIINSLKPEKNMLSRLGNGAEIINVRGEVLLLVRLSEIFSIDGAESDPVKALVIILETYGQKIGLLVDNILKQQQVVIKTVGDEVKKQDFFTGGAILSDGKVGLILNIEEIVNQSRSGSRRIREGV
ncbi:MAG: chemotaxis protein CheA [Deltaproteobacteria bacterium]|nr:chemotaxis protein CheA [Deltaproteobacteria bacterium]